MLTANLTITRACTYYENFRPQVPDDDTGQEYCCSAQIDFLTECKYEFDFILFNQSLGTWKLVHRTNKLEQ